ncbi:MAG: hypothetical protein A2X86_12450 [Bdellovibrionales bacterium GWA2_49_15]|nr:MAG: hypothetical protein A2X86_12450 [Bdellovibrionales bacterium GWA2_49_15]
MNQYLFDDIYLGMSKGFNVEIIDDMVESFYAITKDSNPLHRDKNYAKDKGFKSNVVYGLLTASFYSTLVGVHLPGKYALLHGLKVDFTRPVYVGNRLFISGDVVGKHDTFRRVEIRAKIINQDGETVSRAEIMVGMNE